MRRLFRALARDEVAQHVDGELGDRAEAGAVDHLPELLVERPGDLERDVGGALGHAR